MSEDKVGKALAHKYEAVFCIFLAVIVYLGRSNEELVYPAILYLFLALLSLNFLAVTALRLWPSLEWASASIIMANCGVITAILAYSGGPQSNLWVLYLLPIYTVSMLLGRKETAWITLGVVGFNTAFYLSAGQAWNAAPLFEICVKDGLFIFSAALISRLVGSERKAAATLRRQRRELDELEERTRKLVQVGLMSAGIVHDLKTPLMVIRGMADICLKQVEADSSLRRDVEAIDRSARVCQTIVQAMLEAARAEQAPRVSCEVHEILRSAIALCSEGLLRGGVEIETAWQGGEPRVRATESELQRVFVNLLSNAGKAMPEGGRIDLRTRTVPGLGGRRWIEIEVVDTGPGLSEAALAALFKPFGTTRPDQGGTGLGLYTSREIVHGHGGTLSAGNARGGGARFVVSLPLERVSELAAA